ncbi:MAG: CHC2 zinc finger domain-containing protein [Oscillospiraceae bacterium]|nr:CHC2 zinc finger domain-containing protein [Oscillospiraceae bacterium]
MQNLHLKEKSLSAGTERDEAYKNNLYAGQSVCEHSDNNIISHKNRKINNFNTDLFAQIKNLLNIKDVLDFYGVQVNPKSYALCPFHGEKTASFRVYDDHFYCYGCGEHGDVIAFIMIYFNLTAIEAAIKLDSGFNLNLLNNTSGYISHISIKEIQADKRLVSDFDKWIKRAFRVVSTYYRYLKFWGEQYFVNNVQYFGKYLSDIEDIWYVETLLDIMIEVTMNDFEKQVRFYSHYGEWVEYIDGKYQLDP